MSHEQGIMHVRCICFCRIVLFHRVSTYRARTARGLSRAQRVDRRVHFRALPSSTTAFAHATMNLELLGEYAVSILLYTSGYGCWTVARTQISSGSWRPEFSSPSRISKIDFPLLMVQNLMFVARPTMAKRVVADRRAVYPCV